MWPTMTKPDKHTNPIPFINSAKVTNADIFTHSDDLQSNLAAFDLDLKTKVHMLSICMNSILHGGNYVYTP